MEDTAIPHAGIDLKCVIACFSDVVLMRDLPTLDRYVAAGLMFGISGEMTAKAQVGVEVKTGFKWGIEKGPHTP